MRRYLPIFLLLPLTACTVTMSVQRQHSPSNVKPPVVEKEKLKLEEVPQAPEVEEEEDSPKVDDCSYIDVFRREECIKVMNKVGAH